MEPIDLDVDWVEVSLEAPMERRLEVLLLLSAAAEYFLEVYFLECTASRLSSGWRGCSS